MKLTTIQVDAAARRGLERLKNYPREPLNDVIRRLIEDARAETLSPKELAEVEEGLAQIRRGEGKPIERVARELGIKL